MLDLEWLKRLIRLMDEADIDSVEISRFATTVKISKSPPVHLGGPSALGGPPGPGRVAAGEPSGDGTAAPTAAAEEGEAAEEEPGEELYEVQSPMVGTFYRAPAPDAPPYVEVGDRVSKGQTLCILEAMKLMNELESEVAGVIREISVQNADPVEYGQLLFRIEPD